MSDSDAFWPAIPPESFREFLEWHEELRRTHAETFEDLFRLAKEQESTLNRFAQSMTEAFLPARETIQEAFERMAEPLEGIQLAAGQLLSLADAIRVPEWHRLVGVGDVEATEIARIVEESVALAPPDGVPLRWLFDRLGPRGRFVVVNIMLPVLLAVIVQIPDRMERREQFRRLETLIATSARVEHAEVRRHVVVRNDPAGDETVGSLAPGDWVLVYGRELDWVRIERESSEDRGRVFGWVEAGALDFPARD